MSFVERDATIRKLRIVQTEGARQVARGIDHYNPDAVISVGDHVNSILATCIKGLLEVRFSIHSHEHSFDSQKICSIRFAKANFWSR